MGLNKDNTKLLIQWVLRTIAVLLVGTATLSLLATITVVLLINDASIVILQEKGLSHIQELLTFITLSAFFLSAILWIINALWFFVKTTPNASAINSYE